MGDDRTAISYIAHDWIEQSRLCIDGFEVQIRNRKPSRARRFLQPTDIAGISIFDLEPLHQADHTVCAHLVENSQRIRSDRVFAAEPQSADGWG